jgi:DNA-binding SARP family transcriptional activator
MTADFRLFRSARQPGEPKMTTASVVQGASQVMVEIRALGPIEATVSGRPTDLGPPKQRALLALLVSQVGRPVSVDVILEVLWTGHPPPSATTSLQAYISNLRRLLEPGRAPRAPATVLRTTPLGYLLNAGVVDVDVRRFGEHVTAGWRAWDRGARRQALHEFESGLALWRGQAYPEVADAPSVLPEVARLEELRLSVFEMRCAARLAVGAHEVVVAELGAFMKANPLREYGCELLSLALYRAGRQADALEVLRTIRVRLNEEMGIDPGPALQERWNEILNQAPTLDWRPAPGDPIVVPGDAPAAPPPARPSGMEVFVGRETALRELAEALTATEASGGRVVAVSGEPGIGKTSLLRRFAGSAGVPVLWGTCPEHVAAPSLWPWAQVLRATGTTFPARPVSEPVAELIDCDTRPQADDDVIGATLRRFEAIVRYLAEMSKISPAVVILDHFHRADPSSLRLLAHLAESAPVHRLLVVVSYCSDEAPILAETLAALSRGELGRIALTGLDSEDVRTLAETLLHRKVGRHTADRLRSRTGGNPFFLLELIKLLTSEQRLDDPRTAPVPLTVREVALRRVARLPRPAVELLSVAAVAGRHFDVGVVAEVVPIGIDAALEILDIAVSAELVVEDQDRLGWFHFTHALVAEALYESTGRLRRARLRQRLGAACDRRRGTGSAGHSRLAPDASLPLMPLMPLPRQSAAPPAWPEVMWPLSLNPSAD